MLNKQLLARSRTLAHPSGTSISTPILVPSFSSKGFPAAQAGKPWVSRILEVASEWLTETMLISAYDIHHKNLPSPTDLSSTPDLTIVDSGGYEAGVDEDLSATAVKEHRPLSWTSEDVRAVYDRWPARFNAMFVSYDHPKRRVAFEQQVHDANVLFEHYPNQMHSLLIKPATETQAFLESVLRAVESNSAQLRPFHAIGVTEKELGNSFLDRMQRIAELRLALDDGGVAAPIQVFGALDPIAACLYFMSGAEIFDGLTWLRYAYSGGTCMYRANYGAISIGLDRRDQFVDIRTMADNIDTLRRLELSMRRVALYDDINYFLHHVELFRQAYDDLRARMKGRI